MKNNRGKLLLCIWIICTFALSMKMKNLRSHERNFSRPGRDKKDSQTGAVGNRI